MNDAILAQYCRDNSFETVTGTVKFGEGGEWAKPRVLQVQFQHVDSGEINNFRDSRVQVVVSPSSFASGELIYPYDPKTNKA